MKYQGRERAILEQLKGKVKLDLMCDTTVAC